MEMWAKIDGFPNYDVSDYGRVRNHRTGRIMKTSIDNNGYVVVCLSKYGKQYLKKVHILVAEYFVVKNIGDTFVAFIDGNRNNIYADNLYWTKNRDPYRRYTIRNRRMMYGIKHKNAKPIRVIETGQIFGSIAEAADELGLSEASVSKSLNFTYYHNRKGYHFEELNQDDLIW